MSFVAEVGGSFVSACVRKLVDKVVSYISDQYGYEANVKNKLKCLAVDLRVVQSLLYEADKRRIQNPALQLWLRDLEDACYKAEDVLDMFEYKILEDKFEKTHNHMSITPRILFKQARTIVKRFTFSDDEVTELNKVFDEFNSISNKSTFTKMLIDSETTITENLLEMMQSREMASFITDSQLVGRDKEKIDLEKQLLEINSNDDASSSNTVHVLPIVGIAGVGKTALVQDVYQRIKDRFDLKAWVFVSNKFDVKGLAKEIIESVCIDNIPQDIYKIQNFGRILEILNEAIKGKKFLIVLDDVWNELASKWEMLHAILNCGGKGSRVVVTTRSRKIADMMRTTTSITLDGLLGKDFERLFVKCAFGNEDPNNYPDLEIIGREIARKLGGNPLAAKTMGGVLRNSLNMAHWNDVMERKFETVRQQEDGIMPVLRLSYEYLPTHLKQCFIYCSLFPQDYLFKVTKLVELWRAHGYIQSDEEENIGVKYFDGLLSRFFFQKAIHGDDMYIIYDLLHHLVRQLSNGEAFDVDENNPIKVSRRVRHLYVVGDDNLSLVCNNDLLKNNLRSLVVSGCSNNFLKMLKELRGLRVLILDGYQILGFLSVSIFSKMVHLRCLYMEVQEYGTSNDRRLPKSLGKLYHIQVIRAGKWNSNKNENGVLPKRINRLMNMRRLEANTRGVAWLGTLTLLRELRFRVNFKNEGFEMRQLRNMSELRELEIWGLRKVGRKEEACEAMLANKNHLKLLKFFWADDEASLGNDDDDDDGDDDGDANSEVLQPHQIRVVVNNEEVLGGLEPHQNVETLHICHYLGRHIPGWWNKSWASSSCLQEIRLDGCLHWKFLPLFGLFRCLKTLKLHEMNAVEFMGTEFCDGDSNNNSNSKALFKKLETLFLWKMSELKECLKANIVLFSHLSSVFVAECPKLKGPLFLPSQLKVLSVKIGEYMDEPENVVGVYLRCGHVSILTEWIPVQKLLSVKELKFTDREMKKMAAALEKWIQLLTSLETLVFQDCCKLEYLPSNLLNSLPFTLQKLAFVGCHKLISLPGKGFPTSLQVLAIKDCSYELTEGCMYNGREWRKISHIPTIIIDDIIVQRHWATVEFPMIESASQLPMIESASQQDDIMLIE